MIFKFENYNYLVCFSSQPFFIKSRAEFIGIFSALVSNNNGGIK